MASFRPFSLTYVVYQENDNLGKLLALFSLAPVFIVVSLTTLIASRRDLRTISLMLGVLINEVINYILKTALQEARPSISNVDFIPKYGMPSNHSQFMGFLAMNVTLWAVKHWKISTLWKILSILGIWALTFIVGVSRIYLLYHTFNQVFVGIVAGCVFGYIWHVIIENVFLEYFQWIQQLPLMKMLYVRDTTRTDNLLALEYNLAKSSSKSW